MESKAIQILLVLSLFYTTCISIDCYVCTNQENNNEKCLKRTKACEPGEDACMTEISWKTMPYWQKGADKQLYITKRCSTKAYCEKARNRSMPYCTHIGYEDWRCVECCLGDKCNYFTFLSGSTARSNMLLLLASVASALVINYFLRS